MNKLTIKARIIIGFGITLAIIVAICGNADLQIHEIDTAQQLMKTDCLPGIAALTEVNGLFRTSYGNILEHVLADDLKAKESLEKEIQEIANRSSTLYSDYEKTISSPEDRALFQELGAARKAVGEVRDNVVLPLSRQQKAAEAKAALATQLIPKNDAYIAAVEKLMAFNRKNLDAAMDRIGGSATSAVRGTNVGAALALLFGIATAVVLIRSINRALISLTGLLDSSSSQVAAASGQVSSSAQTLAEGASEQAASLEETSASLEEISSMTRRNAENAISAKELANQTLAAADSGAGEMAHMDAAMHDIKGASDNIAKIIKTIDEIAFQTNILALNAAVEAARAGEAGMGFAVVADEVRNLAQRSAQAAKETADKIEDCIQKSEAGVQISSKVGSSLNEILAKARQVDSLVAEIATASREQSQGIEQVNTALTQMDKVTQSNAASAEESASAAEELSGQAQALKEAVGDLKVLVGGEGAPSRSGSTAAKPVPYSAESAPRKQARIGTTKNGAAATSGSARNRSKAAGANGVHASNGQSSNGHLAQSSTNGRHVIPLEGEFNDF